jgi:Flp pilus assembly protein TadD
MKPPRIEVAPTRSPPSEPWCTARVADTLARMSTPHVIKRSLLLALTLLSACAADPSAPRAEEPKIQDNPRIAVTGGPGALLSARHATAEQDMDIAADAFRRALATDPDNLELRQQAFLASLMAGRRDTVQLARLLPQNQAAMLDQANEDVRDGNWQQAEARFASLPRQGVQDIMRTLLSAWAQLGAGHAAEALATLKPLMAAQRLRAVYTLNAAMIADVADMPEAGDLYRSARAEAGAPNLQLTRMMSSWQARHGEKDAAEAGLRELVASSDDLSLALPGLLRHVADKPVRNAADGVAEVYLVIAAALQSQDAKDFASILVRLSLDMRPDLTAARLLAAEIAMGGKHPETGAALLAAVSADDPLAGVVRLRRAGLEQKLGHNDAALGILEQLSREQPDRPEPHLLQADILRIAQRFPDSVAEYDRALALIPNPGRQQWPIYYQRGIALERAKQWSRAEADFLKALELAPDQPQVLNYLGYSWTEQGRNMVRARQMIERASAQRPNDGAIADSLGWVVLRQGDIPAAVRNLERAVELEPGDSTINGHLGDAYWAAGRKLEAQFQWRRALTLKPEPDEVPKLEAKLREGEAAKP